MDLARIINWPFSLVGLRLAKLYPDTDDYDSYMLSQPQIDRLRDELTDVALGFFVDHVGLMQSDRPKLRDSVDTFCELYPKRPVSKNEGGSGFGNCFWLYLLTRHVAPAFIVESGVFMGQSTWFMRQACPQAELHCFDVNFLRLVYRDPTARYYESDWAGVELPKVAPQDSFCFFDDHVNQALRVRQAYDRGFRRLLFDDTVPTHKIYCDGMPPLPTLEMLFDSGLRDGDSLEWIWRGKKKSYVHDIHNAHGANNLIREYTLLPEISARLRYGKDGFLCWAQLND